MKPTKVSKALAFLQANPGATAYAAAKHAKCSPATVYAKLNADRAKREGVCPQCGANLKEQDK